LKANEDKIMDQQKAIVILENNILNSNKKIIELNEQIAVGNNNSQLVSKQLQESKSNYDKLLLESTKELNNFMDKSNNEKKYYSNIISTLQQKLHNMAKKIKHT
jgi:predicted S18 family serine protease